MMKLQSIAIGAALAMPALVAQAVTPFAGTWTIEPQQTEFALNSALGLSLEHGTYKRTTCAVSHEVPADGADHPVSDDPFIESMAVRVKDDLVVEVAQKAHDQLIWQGRYEVASDRKSMTLAFEDHRPAQAVSGRIRFERVGEPVASGNALSGTWQPTQLLDLSPSGRTVTFRDTEHGLVMQAADGRSFDIVYGGGNNEPLMGYERGARVHVGRRAPNMLQINRTQNGEMVELVFGTVSPDGKQMQWSQVDWLCRAQTILTMVKQAPS
jgi:hypothetical protein